MQVQRNTLNFEGQKIFVGIDVHKKDWKVSIRSKELTYKIFTQDPSAKDLVTHLYRNFPGAEYYSAYEAGFSGFLGASRFGRSGHSQYGSSCGRCTDQRKRKGFQDGYKRLSENSPFAEQRRFNGDTYSAKENPGRPVFSPDAVDTSKRPDKG